MAGASSDTKGPNPRVNALQLDCGHCWTSLLTWKGERQESKLESDHPVRPGTSLTWMLLIQMEKQLESEKDINREDLFTNKL